MKKTIAATVVVNLITILFDPGWGPPRPAPFPPDEIKPISGTDNTNRRADIVFVHGLGGHWKKTWLNAETGFFWPEQLGKQFPDVGIWSLKYGASASAWLGNSMPLTDRSKNTLQLLRTKGIGDRQVIFVCHSLGGLVVKQMIRDAADLDNKEWDKLRSEIRGVLFLATPHTGSATAGYSETLDRLAFGLTARSVNMRELQKNEPMLRELNEWYQVNAPKMEEIKHAAYYEKLAMWLGLIVDEASGNPMLPGVRAIPWTANHLTICKPIDQNDPMNLELVRFVTDSLDPISTPSKIQFPEFVKEFQGLRYAPAKLRAFKEERVRKSKVKWKGVIKVKKDEENARFYMIIPTGKDPATERDYTLDKSVAALFTPYEFRPELDEGKEVEIEGVFHKNTSAAGAVLYRCKVLNPPKNAQ